jgi:hypothetical protein
VPSAFSGGAGCRCQPNNSGAVRKCLAPGRPGERVTLEENPRLKLARELRHPAPGGAALFQGRHRTLPLERPAVFWPWWPEVCGPQEVRMLRLSQLFNLLFFLWAETGSVLEPDDGPRSNAGDFGDTGSILDPNG